MASLEKIREDLCRRLDMLTTRGGKVGRDLQRPTDADWAERAQEIQNDEVLENLDERTREEIEQIRGALGRIDDGSYGSCNDCGETITMERLVALPFTGLCIDCAERTDARS